MSSTFVTVCPHSEYGWASYEVSPEETTTLLKDRDEAWIRLMAKYHAGMTLKPYKELFITVVQTPKEQFSIVMYVSSQKNYLLLTTGLTKNEALIKAKIDAANNKLPFVPTTCQNGKITPISGKISYHSL